MVVSVLVWISSARIFDEFANLSAYVACGEARPP
jgi:hypothetical protein